MQTKIGFDGEFEVGKEVRHKNYSRLLRIKKIYETVAVVERIEEEMEYNIFGTKVYPVFVCRVSNLFNA